MQKYAAASAVAVWLHEEREHLFVEVRDDGRGFDVTTAARGAGLTNMEDRLDALGGTLQIESTIAPASRVTAQIRLCGPGPCELTESVFALADSAT